LGGLARSTLAGLRGGHSGVDIHEERGNAIKLLVRVLRSARAPPTPLRLAGLVPGAPRATPCPAKPAPPCALPAGQAQRRWRLRSTAAQALLRERAAPAWTRA
jgi:dipeptidase D